MSRCATLNELAVLTAFELAPKSSRLNLALVAELSTPPVVLRLEDAFNSLIKTYPQLILPWAKENGEWTQANAEQCASAEFNSIACSETDLDAKIAEFCDAPFDISAGVLCRLGIFECLDSRDYRIALVSHHLVTDAISLQNLGNVLSALYNGEQMKAPKVVKASKSLDPRAASYWQDYLRVPLDRTDFRLLSSGAPRNTEPLDIQCLWGQNLVYQLSQVAAQHAVTPALVFNAILMLAMSRYFDSRSFAVALAASGRAEGEEEAVGLFANPIHLLWPDVENLRFDTLLNALRRPFFTGVQFDSVPLPDLVELVRPDLEMGQTAFANTLVSWLSAVGSNDAGLFRNLTNQTGQRGSIYDLFVTVMPLGPKLNVKFQFAGDSCDPVLARQFADHVRQVAEAVLAAPAEDLNSLEFWSPDALSHIEGPAIALPEEESGDRLVAYIDRALKHHSDHVALTTNKGDVSYRDLDQMADQVAAKLVDAGLRIGDIVALSLPRDETMIAAMIGVLRAGCTYLPLDPEYPASFRQSLFELSGATVLVATEEVEQSSVFSGTKILLERSSLLDILGSFETAVARSDIYSEAAFAYLIFTSGSTGTPKGVPVSRTNLLNFLLGMDAALPQSDSEERPVWLAHTTMSFDIAVLEMLWTLTRGYRVVVHRPAAATPQPSGLTRSGLRKTEHGQRLSLYFFPSTTGANEAGYKLLLEGSTFADENGFESVWFPERHFHEFGGFFPNPSVAAAAVAVRTSDVGIRAGSVVLPLHDPLRVAEEWSMVDNLSGGRIGMSFAPGWQVQDFALNEGGFDSRYETMWRHIDTLTAAWSGEQVPRKDGRGADVMVRVFPKPVSERLDTWLTIGGSPEAFEAAGAKGMNVLTHLLGQSPEELAIKVQAYRKARAAHDHGPGRVTLMLHAYIAEDAKEIEEVVKGPFMAYLETSVSLAAGAQAGQDAASLIEAAYERYLSTSSLIGTAKSVQPMLKSCAEIGIDEIACLVDFGVETDTVLSALPRLTSLFAASEKAEAPRPSMSIPQTVRDYADWILSEGVTHAQGTPAFFQMLLNTDKGQSALRQLQMICVGGEVVPEEFAARMSAHTDARVFNMYGPTETSIWSAVRELTGNVGQDGMIGNPIANTGLVALDRAGRPVPRMCRGVLHITGAGVTDGYWQEREKTERAFVPNLWDDLSERAFSTGDIVTFGTDGRLQFLGRTDHQLKVLGYRVSPPLIEAALMRLAGVKSAAVIGVPHAEGNRLVGCVVAEENTELQEQDLRRALSQELPAYMVPAELQIRKMLPNTLNMKVDRKALREELTKSATTARSAAAPTMRKGALFENLQSLWQRLLGRETIDPSVGFFDLGGNSLLLSRMQAEILGDYDVALSLADVFEASTLASLTDLVEERQANARAEKGTATGTEMNAIDAARARKRRKRDLARNRREMN